MIYILFVGYIGDVSGNVQSLGQSGRLVQTQGISAIPRAETSHMATAQPSATSWRTSSRRMPEPPPATTVILPEKSFIGDPPLLSERL